MRNVKVRIQFI